MCCMCMYTEVVYDKCATFHQSHRRKRMQDIQALGRKEEYGIAFRTSMSMSPSFQVNLL